MPPTPYVSRPSRNVPEGISAAGVGGMFPLFAILFIAGLAITGIYKLTVEAAPATIQMPPPYDPDPPWQFPPPLHGPPHTVTIWHNDFAPLDSHYRAVTLTRDPNGHFTARIQKGPLP